MTDHDEMLRGDALHPEHAAVYRLRAAAVRGMRAMVPGVLEPLRLRVRDGVDLSATGDAALTPPPEPLASADAPVPTASSTSLGPVARVGLRLTDAFIRLLESPPRR